MLDAPNQSSMASEQEDEKTTPGQVVIRVKHAYTFDISVFLNQADELAGKHGQEGGQRHYSKPPPKCNPKSVLHQGRVSY